MVNAPRYCLLHQKPGEWNTWHMQGNDFSMCGRLLWFARPASVPLHLVTNSHLGSHQPPTLNPRLDLFLMCVTVTCKCRCGLSTMILIVKMPVMILWLRTIQWNIVLEFCQGNRKRESLVFIGVNAGSLWSLFGVGGEQGENLPEGKTNTEKGRGKRERKWGKGRETKGDREKDRYQNMKK